MAEPNADALAKQLKDKLAQRRPRPWKAVLATLIASVLLLAWITWWLYPRPKGAPLQIIGLDSVFTPEETPIARAQLLAPPDDRAPRPLSGHTVIFREMLPPGGKPRALAVTSDENGQASAELPLTASGEFLVLYVDPDQRQGSPQQRGRIFVWPKDAPLLIVDADETLIADELDAQASPTLTRAAKEGWHIVYLALASTLAHDFRTARGWIEKQPTLPKGPVLGRQRFGDEESVEHVRRTVLKELQDRFTGKTLALVKNAESAQTCKDLGLPTIVVDKTAWAKVRAKFK